MYRLVAIDLDGTLLNSQSKISERNRQAIGRAIEKGVEVVICSGRILSGAKVFAREVGAEGIIITCNGAIISDVKTGAVLYDNPMSKEDCYKIIDVCRKEKVYFHVYTGNVMFTEELKYGALFYWNINESLPRDERIDIRMVEDIGEAVRKFHKSASKFVVISEDRAQLLRIRKQVACIDTVEVMSSNYNNIEVVNRGVSKGSALKFISEKLGIPREEVIAIGDNENDYSMIQFAGLGVAMGNAENFVKEAADYVTLSNDEDGVAEVFKKFVL
mgnify:CR=1 FL=1